MGRPTSGGDQLSRFVNGQTFQASKGADWGDTHCSTVGNTRAPDRVSILAGLEGHKRALGAGTHCKRASATDRHEPVVQLGGNRCNLESFLQRVSQGNGLLGIVGDATGGIAGMIRAVGGPHLHSRSPGWARKEGVWHAERIATCRTRQCSADTCFDINSLWHLKFLC